MVMVLLSTTHRFPAPPIHFDWVNDQFRLQAAPWTQAFASWMPICVLPKEFSSSQKKIAHNHAMSSYPSFSIERNERKVQETRILHQFKQADEEKEASNSSLNS